MNLANYKTYELKAILQHLKLKTSGTKMELIGRLSELEEEVVVKAIAAIITNDHDDGADSGNEWRDEVLQLRAIVEQLSNDIVSLRASGRTETSVAEVVNATTTTSNTPTYSSATVHQAVMTSMQPISYSSITPGMSNNYSHTQPGVVYTTPVAQNVFLPLPQTSVQASTPTIPITRRPLTTTQFAMPSEYSPTTTMQLNNNQTTTQFALPPTYSPTTTMQQISQGQSIKEISSILPTFDPVDENYTSIQFIERIEKLKTVYGWNDTILIFAVLGKLKGVAKQWADAQPVFETWANFVAEFVNDFPHVSSKANAHVRLMNSKMSRNEKIIEYYYRMLAMGRRDNIDDVSIIQYIINGIFDENIKRTLSAMCFNNCSDLLKTIMSVNNMTFDRQVWTKRVFEVPKNGSKEQNYNTGREKENEVPKTNGSGPICYNCRQRGHISRNCTKPQRKYQNENLRNVRHENVNNLRHEDVSNESVAEAEVNTVQSKKINELVKDVFIQGADNMIKCCALIDSGSGKSLIKRSISSTSKCTVVPCREKLMGFAGGKIVCYEKILADINIDDIVRTVELIVIEDDVMSYDMIVGLDILSKGTVIIEDGVCKIMSIKNSPVEVVRSIVSDHEENKFKKLVMSYGDCFGEKLSELGKSKRFKMDIVVNSEKPIYKRPYNIPFAKRDVVERIISELMQLNIVRPSSSLYASPIVMVAKQNGEDRLCVDYRELNSITEKQPWYMPTVDGVLSSLKGHKCFTTLDLMSGYYQIAMGETSKQYTAFITHHGHYEFERMPFGLRNAPCTFQRMMAKVIEPLNKKVVSYVDEIIIATDTVEENIKVLEEFLVLIREEGLTLRISKCSFLKSAVSFLGHVVNENGIQPGSEKTLSIRNFPVPKNVLEIRRFLGLTGFFRKFVQNYAHMAKPLTNLTKKEVDFVWCNECQESFRNLITALTNAPVLAIYDVSKQHQLHTDASNVGIAAILLQVDYGKLQPVAYFSRCCSKMERNYHAYELEVLAVVEACERFRMYLLGKEFTIVTDCQSITTAKLSKPMIPRVARWFLKLLEYDYKIIHRAGVSMKHVNAMSRAPVIREENKEPILMVMNITTDDWVTLMQQEDPKLNEIIGILSGKVHSEHKKQIEGQYMIKNNRLFHKGANSSLTLVVPKGMRWRILKIYHDDIGHPGVENVIKRLTQHFWFSRMRNFVKSYLKSCIECAYHKDPGRKACQLYVMQVPNLPFEVLHLDHLGPFIKSRRSYEHVLVCVDALTRYVVIHPTKTTHTKHVLSALDQLTLYFGLPRVIVTDRGTAFTSAAFEEYCHNNNVQHIKVAVRTPRANGLAERVNQSIIMYLKTTTIDPKDWDSDLRVMQWTLNTKN